MKLEKFLSWLLPLYIFLLPWQARYIIAEYSTSAPYYGDRSFYVTDVLFLVLLSIWVLWLRKNKLVIREQLQTKWTRRLVLGLLGLWAFALLSLLWSPDQAVGYEKWYRLTQAGLLGAMIAFGPVSAARIVAAFLLSSSVQALWALVQFIQQGIPASTWLGMSAQEPKDLGVSVIEYADERWLRAYGTLPHPNMLGGMLSVASLLAMAVYVQTYVSMVPWYGKWASMPASEKQSLRNHDLGSFITFLFSFIGLLLTFSRSAWLGFALGAAAIALLGLCAFRGRARWAILIAMGKLSVVAVVIFVFFNAIFGPLWIARTHDQSRLADVSVSERAQLQQDAKRIISEHPLRGVGIGAYLPVLMNLDADQPTYRYQPVHNTWLLLWAELGVAGLLLFAAWLIAVMVSAKTVAKSLLQQDIPSMPFTFTVIPFLSALGVMFYFDHFWFSLPFGMLLSALAIGLVLKTPPSYSVDGKR